MNRDVVPPCTDGRTPGLNARCVHTKKDSNNDGSSRVVDVHHTQLQVEENITQRC